MSTPPVPSRIDEMEQGPPYDKKLKKKAYYKELQIELLKAQRSIRESGDRWSGPCLPKIPTERRVLILCNQCRDLLR